MELRERLHQAKLFAELSSDELAALSDIVSLKTVPKGSMLFFEGDPATGFFILLSGGVRIYKASPDGREYTLHHVQPGQMFAEAAIFRGSGFPANCTATEDAEAAFVPKKEFMALLQQSPTIALKIIGTLSGWLRDFTRQVEHLSLKEVPARLAAHLLALADAQGRTKIVLPTSKSELANSLGTISETLSRNFKRLKEIGAIDMDGKAVTVLDRQLLQAIADGEKF
jgi:CRP/FNR family transcriptional regulator